MKVNRKISKKYENISKYAKMYRKYLENKTELEDLEKKIQGWWTHYKENLKETFLIIKNV